MRAFIMADVFIEILAHFAIYLFACCHQLYYEINVSTPSVLRFLSVIRHKSPHYTHVFSKKAQHLWRWISLQTFTQGRLVPRQPWAIKSTTPTALHHEGISIAKYIHWDAGMTPTALHHEGISIAKYIHWDAGMTPTALHHEGISIAKYIHWNAGMTPTALIFLIMHNLR